jgi:rubredoxin
MIANGFYSAPIRSSDPRERRAPPITLDAGQRRFIYRGCYFIYEEATGLAQAGIEPGTAFAALPPAWCCPDLRH